MLDFSSHRLYGRPAVEDNRIWDKHLTGRVALASDWQPEAGFFCFGRTEPIIIIVGHII